MNKPFRLYNDDCINVLKDMDDNSVDSIVTDPPYGLSKEPDPYEVLEKWINEEDYKHKHRGFMQTTWDSFVPPPRVWKECLRVLKPGGHIICFSSARTYDWMCMSIRLAGFEIRDQIMWIYGTGMAQGMNIGKAIDKQLKGTPQGTFDPDSPNHGKYKKSTTEQSQHGHGSKYTKNGEWNSGYDYNNEVSEEYKGWNTKLKPAHEPIILARKPVEKGLSVATNTMKHGTGGINIDDCRVPLQKEGEDSRLGGKGSWKTDNAAKDIYEGGYAGEQVSSSELGRFPANIILDGSEEVTEHFPLSKGQQGDVKGTEKSRIGKGDSLYGERKDRVPSPKRNEPISSAARFFYCAKASKKDRSEGLDGFEEKKSSKMQKGMKSMVGHPSGNKGKSSSEDRKAKNHHPTVKPTSLCEYLCRLITPKGGTILDPYMGSGSTGKAAMYEGFQFIGIELDTEEGYFDIATARIEHAWKNSNNYVEETSEETEQEDNQIDDIKDLFSKK